MWNGQNINKQGLEGGPPGQQLTGEQTTVFEQLLCLQSDIEGQAHRVAMALNQIVEELNTGGNVSLETMKHLKAQILLAHMQLDDLKQVLDSIDEQLTGRRSR